MVHESEECAKPAGAPSPASAASSCWAPSRWALWQRDRDGQPAGPGLVHQSEPGRYVSFAFTAHLIEAGIDALIGTVGDALDNALMESAVGVYKTELIKKGGPWKTL